MIARLLLVCMLVPHVFVPSMREGGETPVVGPPSISGETVTRVLAGSPLAPYAVDVYRLGAEAGIDPAFALAIWKHESQFGTTGAATRTRNMGNLVCDAAAHPPARGCDGRWAVYPTWLDAVADWYAYLNRRYVARGLVTVEAILPVYAPPSENDTAGYIAQVRQLMAQWGSGVVGTAPPNPGSIVEEIMDDWLQRPLDELKYWLWHGLATMVWGFNQALLGLVDLIGQFHRLLVEGGFRPAIDAVAEGMLGISRPVFTLGLTLACLFLILLPVGRLLDLVNTPQADRPHAPRSSPVCGRHRRRRVPGSGAPASSTSPPCCTTRSLPGSSPQFASRAIHDRHGPDRGHVPDRAVNP
jgi:hypothetical protein